MKAFAPRRLLHPKPGICIPVLLYTALFVTSAAARHLPEILVTGQGNYVDNELQIDAASLNPAITDTNTLMRRVPGGASNNNGMLSGQIQYRGLFGPRIGARIDGVQVHSGGPNWMDPPLHYAPPALVKQFSFSRGIAPISAGGGIGGGAEVQLKRSVFSDDGSARWQGDLSVSGHSVDAGYNLGGILGFGNDQHRGHLQFARDEGDDANAGEGDIDGTEYERDFYGIGYGFRFGEHELSVDFHHVETGASGTPALPLDIDFFNTEILSLAYQGRIADFKVNAQFSWSEVKHRMDNFTLRPAPDFSALPLPPFVGTDRRFVDADSEHLGFRFDIARELGNGEIMLGFETRFDDNNATVGDPDFEPFFVENFNGTETEIFSGFAQWQGQLKGQLGIELGLRVTHTRNETDPVDAQPAQFADAMGICMPGVMPVPPPCAVRALRNNFNAGDLSRSETTVDWLVRLPWQVSEELGFELAFARKTRAPSYIERFLWIPLEVNAGLADGNNYVGDPALDPEVAHEVEVAMDWRNEQAYFSPRAFYKQIDDFIQGDAIAPGPQTMPIIGVSTNANGDATPLRFANVDAELYGVDILAGYDFTGPLRADAMLSYVRGKRRDINDNLFRIAPPSLHLSLGWEAPQWFTQLETEMVSRQKHVADNIVLDPNNANNNARATAGYVLLHLRAQGNITSAITLNAGIENLLDKHYTDHLSGFNRNLGSDVARGDRLPGRGRNFYATIGYRW